MASIKQYLKLVTTAFILVISAVILFGVNFLQPKAHAEELILPVVSIGTIKAKQGVAVSSSVDGAVKEIFFSAGQYVTQNQVLLILENSAHYAKLKESAAKFRLLQKNYARYLALYQKHYLAAAELDTIKSNIEQAQAVMEQDQANLAKTIIRAPFSGKMGMSQINLGQYITAGQTISYLEDASIFYIDFNIPWQLINENIKVGSRINIKPKLANNKNYAGTVIALHPVLDANTRDLAVRAEINDSDNQLISGMFAEVNWLLPTK